MNGSNETKCHTFSQRDVTTIFTIRVTVASISLTACLCALVVLTVMICCLRVWKTYVHRLKLYLVIVAIVLSVMYTLQVLPMRETAVKKHCISIFIPPLSPLSLLTLTLAPFLPLFCLPHRQLHLNYNSSGTVDVRPLHS